jgi:hypothetical protein
VGLGAAHRGREFGGSDAMSNVSESNWREAHRPQLRAAARQYRKEHPESAARVRARQAYIAAQVRRIRLNDDPDSLLNEQNFEEDH